MLMVGILGRQEWKVSTEHSAAAMGSGTSEVLKFRQKTDEKR